MRKVVAQRGKTAKAEGNVVLKRTVRNYLVLTAFAVAGALMAMQARSDVRPSRDADPDVGRVVATTPPKGIEGVIEVENDLAIREGPRMLARADRDAGAVGRPRQEMRAIR